MYMESDVDKNDLISFKILLDKILTPNKEIKKYFKDVIVDVVNRCNLLYTHICYFIKLIEIGS